MVRKSVKKSAPPLSLVAQAQLELRRWTLERLEGGGDRFLGGENELMARFGVGRVTLRQVARQLQGERLLAVRRGLKGGYFAVLPTIDSVNHVAGLYVRLAGLRPRISCMPQPSSAPMSWSVPLFRKTMQSSLPGMCCALSGDYALRRILFRLNAPASRRRMRDFRQVRRRDRQRVSNNPIRLFRIRTRQGPFPQNLLDRLSSSVLPNAPMLHQISPFKGFRFRQESGCSKVWCSAVESEAAGGLST